MWHPVHRDPEAVKITMIAGAIAVIGGVGVGISAGGGLPGTADGQKAGWSSRLPGSAEFTDRMFKPDPATPRFGEAAPRPVLRPKINQSRKRNRRQAAAPARRRAAPAPAPAPVAVTVTPAAPTATPTPAAVTPPPPRRVHVARPRPQPQPQPARTAETFDDSG